MHDAEFAEIFRTEWPQLVAVLARDLGDLDPAEDAAQEAFAEAARRWPDLERLPARPGVFAGSSTPAGRAVHEAAPATA